MAKNEQSEGLLDTGLLDVVENDESWISADFRVHTSVELIDQGHPDSLFHFDRWDSVHVVSTLWSNFSSIRL